MALQHLRTLSAAACMAALYVVSPLPAAAQTAERVEVPITQTQLSDGNIRYSVPVSFGGSTGVMAMLDTGSSGLRVLSKALAAPQSEDTGVVRDYHFQSGIVLHGSLVKTIVSVGDATTSEPVVIQNVQEVKCGEMRPNCPVSKMDADSYGIGGDGVPNQGFQAILGLSLHHPQAALFAGNPLTSMGGRSWIVELPLPGDSNPGRLIINPTAAERQGFKMSSAGKGPAPSAGAGGPDLSQLNHFPLCTTKATHCPSVKLDTGSSDGLEPFYSNTILFDQAHNSIGAKPRHTSASQ